MHIVNIGLCCTDRTFSNATNQVISINGQQHSKAKPHIKIHMHIKYNVDIKMKKLTETYQI